VSGDKRRNKKVWVEKEHLLKIHDKFNVLRKDRLCFCNSDNRQVFVEMV
jgi:hypothetical protein